MKINFCGIFTLLILLIGAPSQADTLYFAAQAGVSTAPTSGNENPNDPTDNFILDTQNGVNAAVACPHLVERLEVVRTICVTIGHHARWLEAFQ